MDLTLRTPEGLQAYLSSLPHTASDLDFMDCTVEKLTGGTANLTCLTTLRCGDQCLVKHAEDISGSWGSIPASRARLEHDLLKALESKEEEMDASPSLTRNKKGQEMEFHVRTPHAKDYFADTNTQVIQYIPETIDLRSWMASNERMEQIARSLGTAIGKWTANQHTWGRTSSADSLRSIISEQGNSNKALKHALNYGRFRSSLQTTFPRLLDHFTEADWKSLDTPAAGEADRAGVIHGDLWTGNILVRRDLAAPGNGDKQVINVIDFELAQISTPPFDLGQLFAELWLLHHFRGRKEALTVIEGCIAGYGRLPRSEVWTVVKTFGVHLAVWPPHAQWWKDGDEDGAKMKECVRHGAECVLAGLKRDEKFFTDGPMATMFV